jgi:hypothetical protein
MRRNIFSTLKIGAACSSKAYEIKPYYNITIQHTIV